MPVSSFHGLNTTLRGLLAHQRAIDTTGHNIANADTVGYSRQEATLGTTAGLTLPTGSANTGGQAMLGSGVDVSGYRRVRESFLDLQFRAQNMQLGEQSTMSRSLDQIELSLSEPSDNGMSTLLNKFWSSWGDVANNPESQAARQSVIDSASDVTSALGRLDAQLTLASGEAQADFNTLIAPNSEIDLASREIAQLNDQIKRAVASGAQPNDMLDRRDVLLDQLSGYAQLKVTDLGGGSIRVAFAQDAPLADVELVNDAAATFNANSATLTNPLSGKLGALNDVYRAGGVVAQYRAQLDGVASQLTGAVNAVHGAPAFFAGATAATIAVAVSSATLKTTATGTAGGNEIARAMSELRFAQPPAVAPDAAYRTLVSRIGTDVKEARRLEVNAQAMVNGVDQRRLSTSGVSLDEEMTNLVRFQRGYQASARAMNTFDEMLDQLINRTGRVGL